MARVAGGPVRQFAAVLIAAASLTALGPAPRAVQNVQSPEVSLRAGAVIDRSVRVRPGTYRLRSTSLDQPAIIIRGAGVTVDMTGVTIEGGDPRAEPDTFSGAGVLIEDAPFVTLRGLTVRGFKVGVLARRAPRLHLTGLDLSYNWKPRLKSGYEQEHLSDWLSFHQNEKDEWLRYGAAIYLADSNEAEIDHVRAVQGMNGLLVTRSSGLTIWNNTFSFLSGLGIGLYRTTDSRILHNRLDWCVRGYSHGFYYRGQDSSALLMYEQTSRNVVAYNSMTHGGDGVFLWAGQSTMDSGRGGANDNLFYGNDVSHAVANGFELTFSRNVVTRNRIDDSWHGIWGGYSYDSIISHNTFAANDEAIAIEHGQNIRIVGNTFTGGGLGVRLWSNATQDPNWGYPKFRDTASRDYYLRDNVFEDVATAMRVSRTSGLRLAGDRMVRVTTPYDWGDGVPGVTIVDRFQPGPPEDVIPAPPTLPAGMNALLPEGARRGRSTIIVDDWGPYDYRSPKLWPVGPLSDRPLRLRVLGPAGRWRLASARGATVNASSGNVPGEVTVTPAASAVEFAIELEYAGARIVTPRGEILEAGAPYRFAYGLFHPAIDWRVNFWKFDADSDPLTNPEAFAALLKTPPVRVERSGRLAFANARAFGDGFTTRIGITAAAQVTLPPGRYELVVTSDDGIRLWLDDRLVVDDWSIHAPKEDRVPLGGGAHRLRLEYFQNTGAAALQVQIARR
jgi:hypothetical protein